MERPKPQYHRWTDEEINLIAHCRIRKWSYARIRRKHFPSFTKTSLVGMYNRLTLEERISRASTVAGSNTTSHITSRNKNSTHSRPVPQPKDNVGAHGSSTLRREEDNRFIAPVDRINRYNFRPKRCQSFLESLPRHPVDRLRFPHFFKSYRKHLDLDGAPDIDYLPPSKSPSPDPSDRSPSVVSSLPSAASSLELFGLEARSLSPSDHDSSVTSSLPNDRPSPEFFSSEERPPTP